MTCCPNVPPENNAVDTPAADVSTQVLDKESVPEGLLKRMCDEGVARGSRVEVNILPGAKIYNQVTLQYLVANGETQFVGIVTSIDKDTICLAPGWTSAFKFASHEYGPGPKIETGIFEIDGKDVVSFLRYRPL